MARVNNVIVGLGETGMSFARYLAANGEAFSVVDDNPKEHYLGQLDAVNANVKVSPLSDAAFSADDTLYVSPGVPLAMPSLLAARSSGCRMIGDVQLFGELSQSPRIAITGTNGKSTLVDLVTRLFVDQGKSAVMAGNIGTPCLDVLDESAELYVLELSSYQLELASAFQSDIAIVLNLSPDHLDRYESIDEYYETKLRIYDNARSAVVNRDLLDLLPNLNSERLVSIGLDEPRSANEFGVSKAEATWLVLGDQKLVDTAELQIAGEHNWLNILAAFAIGSLWSLDTQQMIETAKAYKGLSHRMQKVRSLNAVTYINDSKATNPGAMQAAVSGLESTVVLIAGGDTKDASFSGVARYFGSVKEVLLIGERVSELEQAFADIKTTRCGDLASAVQAAHAIAEQGDTVLLSPGCASFDQFENYADRGDQFTRLVMELKS